MKDVTFNITLSLAGPVITAATEAGSFGVDLPFARNRANQYYLPGTLVKGRLREALEKHDIMPFLGIGPDDIADWLGNESAQTGNRPERGRLIFRDFVFEDTAAQSRQAIRHRIEMDQDRGAVKKGAYLVIEAPFGSGEAVDFKGSINAICGDEELPRIRSAIEKGLRWIPALGGQKGVGFGRLTGVRIDMSERVVPAEVVQVPSCEALRIKLYPKSPFCIARPQASANLFESEDFIPGGALKGSLANTLNQIVGRPLNAPIDGTMPSPWQDLGEYFSLLRFDHAFPAPREGTTRPLHYPLSTVRVAEETYDVALMSGPVLIKGMAPAFCIDWKSSDRKKVGEEFGWGESPPRVLRVRTKMDFGTRRADEGKLFAYEMIDPRAHVWHSRVDFTKIPPEKRADIRSQLEAVLRFGLKYLGKTKTDVDVQISESLPDTAPDPIGGEYWDLISGDTYWVVTLQTPTLMLNPWDQENPINRALVDQEILFNAYQRYWNEISKERLGLVRFFARQELLGRYLHHRFQPAQPYNPFFVTAARSTFVLRPKDANQIGDAKEMLKMWLSQGVPLPQWARDVYGDSWQTCPFLPENGFGEIAVNMACHVSKKPPADPGICKEVGYGS